MSFYRQTQPFGAVIGALAAAIVAAWYLFCLAGGGLWGALAVIPGLVVAPIIGGFVGAIFAPLVVLAGLALVVVFFWCLSGFSAGPCS